MWQLHTPALPKSYSIHVSKKAYSEWNLRPSIAWMSILAMQRRPRGAVQDTCWCRRRQFDGCKWPARLRLISYNSSSKRSGNVMTWWRRERECKGWTSMSFFWKMSRRVPYSREEWQPIRSFPCCDWWRPQQNFEHLCVTSARARLLWYGVQELFTGEGKIYHTSRYIQKLKLPAWRPVPTTCTELCHVRKFHFFAYFCFYRSPEFDFLVSAHEIFEK